LQQWTGGAVFVFGFHNGSAEAFALPHSTRLELARKFSWPENNREPFLLGDFSQKRFVHLVFICPELRSEFVVSRVTVLRLKVSMCRRKDSTFFPDGRPRAA